MSTGIDEGKASVEANLEDEHWYENSNNTPLFELSHEIQIKFFLDFFENLKP